MNAPSLTTTASFELFYSLRSPFARRVRVALQRLAIHFEPRETDVFNPTADFHSANPLALLPVLRITEGATKWSIPDSATILEYLHENHGERIWPRDLKARAKVRAASTLAEGLMTLAVNLFLESQRKSPDDAWKQEWTENLVRTLDHIAKTSPFEMPWKVSDLQLTQAGYDLVIALEYFDVRLPSFDWRSRYPQLIQFLERHKNRGDLLPSSPPPA